MIKDFRKIWSHSDPMICLSLYQHLNVKTNSCVLTSCSNELRLSTTTTLWPTELKAIAAVSPAIPPPMITKLMGNSTYDRGDVKQLNYGDLLNRTMYNSPSVANGSDLRIEKSVVCGENIRLAAEGYCFYQT